MGTTDSYVLIPLTIIPLTLRLGATRLRQASARQAKTAHLTILAQTAKPPQAMMAGFFKE
jgi:hypothetical protein